MGVNWMKTGADSAKVAEQEAAEQKARAEAQGTTWRFFLKESEEARITFVDGDLIETEVGKILAPPRYYEHNLQINGKWGNTYVCPEKTMPDAGYHCPICAGGDRPSLVALFTIIDHREVKGKNDKVYKDSKRLLVAKPNSMEILAKIAVKRGGLAGCTFDVSRMGENSAAIGSMFDFVEKNDLAVLQTAFTEEIEVNGKKVVVSKFVPVEYDKEIVFRTPEELIKLGLGKPVISGAGTGMVNPGGQNGKGSVLAGKNNYAAEL